MHKQICVPPLEHVSLVIKAKSLFNLDSLDTTSWNQQCIKAKSYWKNKSYTPLRQSKCFSSGHSQDCTILFWGNYRHISTINCKPFSIRNGGGGIKNISNRMYSQQWIWEQLFKIYYGQQTPWAAVFTMTNFWFSLLCFACLLPPQRNPFNQDYVVSSKTIT